mgnify:FL=1
MNIIEYYNAKVAYFKRMSYLYSIIEKQNFNQNNSYGSNERF